MSSAFSPRRLRAPLLVTLIVLLHWLVLGWIAAGTQGIALPAREGDAAISLAQLLPTAPRAAPPSEPVPPPVPKLVQPPLPDFLALPTIAVTEDAVGEPVPPGPPAQTTTAPAAPAPAAAPQLAAAQPAPAATPDPGPAPAAPTVRHYKVDVPPPAELTYEVARIDADGTAWSGQALLSWKRNEHAYRMRFEAGIKIVFARVNLAVLTSEGHLGDTGLAPVTMTEKRRGRSMTATHFDWPGNKMSFSASQRAYPLQPGTQDKGTVPLQLAAIARGGREQLSGDIDIFVGGERDGSIYSFQAVGAEEIDTPLGRLQTVRLARPPRPGSYKSRLDIWLAPAHGWLPVQIRSSEANGAVTTQTAKHIAMTQPGL